MMLLLALLAPWATMQTSADSVALAIERGMAAEGTGDARAMLAAARSLEALGAKPREGEPDLAADWRRQALARGVRDKTPPIRGRVLGPAYSRGMLAPGAMLSTEQVFLAGQKAEIALVPQAGRTLTIRIAARDKAICERAAAGARVKCDWIPTFTNRVQIRIANQGNAPAAYYLVSN